MGLWSQERTYRLFCNYTLTLFQDVQQCICMEVASVSYSTGSPFFAKLPAELKRRIPLLATPKQRILIDQNDTASYEQGCPTVLQFKAFREILAEPDEKGYQDFYNVQSTGWHKKPVFYNPSVDILLVECHDRSFHGGLLSWAEIACRHRFGISSSIKEMKDTGSLKSTIKNLLSPSQGSGMSKHSSSTRKMSTHTCK